MYSICCFDFGTSFSSMAHFQDNSNRGYDTCMSQADDQIVMVNDFPNEPGDGNGITGKKHEAPTQLDENRDPNASRWGYIPDGPSSGRVHTNLKDLFKDEIINGSSHVLEEAKRLITLYFTLFFRHADRNLAKRKPPRYLKLIDEIVLTVPLAWMPYAYQVLEECARDAFVNADILDKGSIVLQNIFTVFEPEAGSHYFLSTFQVPHVQTGQVFVAIDLGGGTCCAITYLVERAYPLRVKVLGHKAIKTGSQKINEDFSAVLKEKMKELHLEGKVVDQWVAKETKKWENTKKGITATEVFGSNFPRSADTFIEFSSDLRYQLLVTEESLELENQWPELYSIRELAQRYLEREDREWFKLTKQDRHRIFSNIIHEVEELFWNQVNVARSAEERNDIRVILFGGFAGNDCLRMRLQRITDFINQHPAQQISIEVPETPGTAVARGGLLRAINKEHGPTRKSVTLKRSMLHPDSSIQTLISSLNNSLQFSVGALRHQPWLNLPKNVRASRLVRQASGIDFDGDRVVQDCVEWFAAKGDVLERDFLSEFLCHHAAPTYDDARDHICRESIYTSTVRKKRGLQNWPLTHPKNKDEARLLCMVAFNTKDWGDHALVRPETRSCAPGRANRVVEDFYRIEFVLKIQLVDKRVKAWVHPVDKPGLAMATQVTPASWMFEPGTQ